MDNQQIKIKEIWKKSGWNFLNIALILCVSATYFSPQFDNKVLSQADLVQGKGMVKELVDHRIKTGKKSIWLNSMFGGMPGYQISVSQKTNLIRVYVERLFQLYIKSPVSNFFVAGLCFYILMIVMGVNKWLALLAALSFAFTANNMVLLEAGHASKLRSISYIPLVLAGLFTLLYKHKWIRGGALFMLGLSLHISANHFQMTYYLAIALFIFMLITAGHIIIRSKSLDSIQRKKTLSDFIKTVSVLIISSMLALAPSYSKISSTMEYAKDTMRGESELKKEVAARVNEKIVDEKIDNEKNQNSSGLGFDYSMAWSFKKRDLIAMFVPDFVGRKSGAEIDKSYDLYPYYSGGKKSKIVNAPIYWGGCENTSGPPYMGAIYFFLIILGAVSMWNKEYFWPLVGAISILIFISLGKNFESFNMLLFDNLPKFSSFRAHSSAVGVLSIFIPLFGILGLVNFLKEKNQKKKVLISGGIALGSLMLLYLFGSNLFNFSHMGDARIFDSFYNQVKDYNQLDTFKEAFYSTRVTFMKSSILSSMFYVSIAIVLAYLFAIKNLKALPTTIGIGMLIVINLISVDLDFINHKSFKRKKSITRNAYRIRPVDKQIYSLEKKGRGYYRVLDNSINTFNSSQCSYFHNTFGGYSAVKLHRIQDVIDSALVTSKGRINYPIISMLNTKYVINRNKVLQPNPNACGPVWFVDNIIYTKTATEELNSLRNFRPQTTAIMRFSEKENLASISTGIDSFDKDNIELTEYFPDDLTYTYQTNRDRLAVFAEAWYGPDKGWKVYLNDSKTPIEPLRANYMLRALKIPKGKGKVHFVFEPDTFYFGEKVSLIGSIIVLLLLAGWLLSEFKEFVVKDKNYKTKLNE